MSNHDSQSVQVPKGCVVASHGLCLASGAVHVWSCDLDSPAFGTPFDGMLSTAELSRAAKFVSDRGRKRFIASRHALRDVLRRYLRCDLESISLAVGTNGKPHLADSDIQFNLSHSENQWACAVAFGEPVGVDIEVLRDIPDCMSLASHHFSPAERAALEEIEPEDRSLAFLRCWTRKEAGLKFAGLGIGADLTAFDVGIGPGEVQVRIASPPMNPVLVKSFSPVSGVIGALGLGEQARRVDHFFLPGVMDSVAMP